MAWNLLTACQRGTTIMDDHAVRIEEIEAHYDRLLEPEAVLPIQFPGTPWSVRCFEPERRLLLAVLADAIKTFQKYATTPKGRGRRLFKEVDGWFSSDDDSTCQFSFPIVCYALGLDASSIRSGLREWLEAQPTPPPATARVPSLPP